MAKEQANGF